MVIPKSVTKIGPSAFEDCSSLESVVMPDSVTEIGICVFKGCTALKEIIIPVGTKDKFIELDLNEDLLFEK